MMSVLKKIRTALRARSFTELVVYGGRIIWQHVRDVGGFLYSVVLWSGRHFVFLGHTYRYACHWYNKTWKNERAVEIPIVRRLMKEYAGKKILEVGNVSSHYMTVTHDIVDKYERAPGVINKDVCEYAPEKEYDFIFAISTLEHVGWDEQERDATKIMRALSHLTSLLSPRGLLVVTLPVGYNSELDASLRSGTLPFTNAGYLVRADSTVWRETSKDSALACRYGAPYEGANGLVVGFIQNS